MEVLTGGTGEICEEVLVSRRRLQGTMVSQLEGRDEVKSKDKKSADLYSNAVAWRGLLMGTVCTVSH